MILGNLLQPHSTQNWLILIYNFCITNHINCYIFLFAIISQPQVTNHSGCLFDFNSIVVANNSHTPTICATDKQKVSTLFAIYTLYYQCPNTVYTSFAYCCYQPHTAHWWRPTTPPLFVPPCLMHFAINHLIRPHTHTLGCS